jgi:HD-like signal output (HDOD) protein
MAMTSFETTARERIDALADSLTPAERTPDTDRFLRALRDTSPTTIRQAPAAAQRALARTKNPDIGLGQLVQVVEEDPTLGQALLRYANSAYYSTGSVVVSLRQAAQRVGASGVHNVVLGVMLEGMLCRPGGEFQAMVDQVRSHLVRTAPIARAIARSFGVPADEAFSLALLHDAGKLIVFDLVGTLRHDLRRDLSITRDVMSRVLKEVHETLGGMAVVHWGLGDHVAEIIATHHRAPPPATLNTMSELLFVAEHAEHAVSGVIPMDLEQWWDAGQITTPLDRVRDILTNYSATDLAA